MDMDIDMDKGMDMDMNMDMAMEMLGSRKKGRKGHGRGMDALAWPDTSLTYAQYSSCCDPTNLLFATTWSTYTYETGEPVLPSLFKNGDFA